MTPCICNGCGGESPSWDKFCANCEKLVTCRDCHVQYKRGQGLQDVDLCHKCLNKAFAKEDEEVEERKPVRVRHTSEVDPEQEDSYAEYGFDNQWELYDK